MSYGIYLSLFCTWIVNQQSHTFKGKFCFFVPFLSQPDGSRHNSPSWSFGSAASGWDIFFFMLSAQNWNSDYFWVSSLLAFRLERTSSAFRGVRPLHLCYISFPGSPARQLRSWNLSASIHSLSLPPFLSIYPATHPTSRFCFSGEP